MRPNDPSALHLDFGQYSGKLMSTVYVTDPKYVQGLAREAREPAEPTIDRERESELLELLET